MKKIETIIEPFKLDALKETLNKIGDGKIFLCQPLMKLSESAQERPASQQFSV